MNIFPIASSSKGNCYYLKAGDTALLLDLGVTWKALSAALSRCRIAPDSIGTVLITHTHTDHVKGLKVSMKRLGAQLYMTAPAAEALEREDAHIITPWESFTVGSGISVVPFSTMHDAPGSVGYLIECPGCRFGLMTDLGTVTDGIRGLLAGCDVMVIESNHDPEMLRTGPYPAHVKSRVRSDYGHLSNAQCAAEIDYFARRGTKHFLLAHLSGENNTPALAESVSAPIAARYGASLTVLPPGEHRMLTF